MARFFFPECAKITGHRRQRKHLLPAIQHSPRASETRRLRVCEKRWNEGNSTHRQDLGHGRVRIKCVTVG